MDEVARWPAPDRADLFEDTAGRMGLTAVLVEKDFWVCWILRRVYEATDRRLLFKGGTSLSKIYRAIHRFSEDVDLSFHRQEFGFAGIRDPATPGLSGRAQRRLLDEMKDASRSYICGDFRTLLEGRILESAPSESPRLTVHEPDPDGQSLRFEYPRALRERAYAGAYVKPAVLLELGMRSHLDDGETRTLEAYAAETHASVFGDPQVSVLVQPLSRTFWEKATALHEKAMVGFGDKRPDRFSRHYADLVEMASSGEGTALMADTVMLAGVAAHKAIFFRVGGEPYSTARPGTLRLRPQDADTEALRRDYSAMSDMFFEAPLPFDELLKRLVDIEHRINGGFA
jgi:hypothetical protein